MKRYANLIANVVLLVLVSKVLSLFMMVSPYDVMITFILIQTIDIKYSINNINR
jgi:hypothetical protein